MSDTQEAVVVLKDRADGGPVAWRNAVGVSARQEDPVVLCESEAEADALVDAGPFIKGPVGHDAIVEKYPEVYSDAAPSPTDATPGDVLGEDLADVLDSGTIGDLEDALASGDYDDVLDAAADYERAHQDRDGAVEAIHDRVQSLSEEAE